MVGGFGDNGELTPLTGKHLFFSARERGTMLTFATVSGGENLWDDRVAKKAAIVPRVRPAAAEPHSDSKGSKKWKKAAEIEVESEPGRSKGCGNSLFVVGTALWIAFLSSFCFFSFRNCVWQRRQFVE